MRRVQPDGDFVSLVDYLADPANHRPRSGRGAAAAARTWDGADQAVGTGDEAPSVFDEVTGAVRVTSSRSGGLPPAVCAWIADHPQAAPRSHATRMAASSGIHYVDPPADGPPKDPAPRAPR
ncbi:hypothetical protein [Streptomyces anthocyanicus]|uniref:hypothetical protein n=1 Tax=Streptomyces anthocyanicus TaxID=68174 RepID=UPI0038059BBC